MFKKIVSVVLSATFLISALVSCSQRGTMEKSFVEEEKNEYSAEVEGVALTIYVDSNVETSGDGSEAAPFASIPEAQAKIRAICMPLCEQYRAITWPADQKGVDDWLLFEKLKRKNGLAA